LRFILSFFVSSFLQSSFFILHFLFLFFYTDHTPSLIPPFLPYLGSTFCSISCCASATTSPFLITPDTLNRYRLHGIFKPIHYQLHTLKPHFIHYFLTYLLHPIPLFLSLHMHRLYQSQTLSLYRLGRGTASSYPLK
jgi:hypothetical protein